MEREIKFRIWNGFEMVYDIIVGKFGIFYVNPLNNGVDMNDTASISPYNTRYPDDTLVMQYTGLRDRYDTEIFEGDIVKDHYSLYENDLCIVSFSEGAYYPMIQVKEGYNCIDKYNPQQFEIIGNIYSNPELLK